MCLYVETDYYVELLSSGSHQARVEHQCNECFRKILPGEEYQYWTGVSSEWDGINTSKMCRHCWHTIELGASLTGCPKRWYWQMIHDLGVPEASFVANVISDEGHDLSWSETKRMFATIVGQARDWMGSDGRLLPIPLPPLGMSDPDDTCGDCHGGGVEFSRSGAPLPCSCVIGGVVHPRELADALEFQSTGLGSGGDAVTDRTET